MNKLSYRDYPIFYLKSIIGSFHINDCLCENHVEDKSFEATQDDPKWDKILIDGENGTWTRREIRNHYVKYADQIMKEIKGKPVMIYIGTGKNQNILKRKHNDKPIILNSKEDLIYWADRRLLSLHRVFEKQTDFGLVDLDVHGDISKEQVNKYAREVASKIKSKYHASPTIYSSGSKKGLHIEFNLKSKMSIDTLRNELRELCEDLNEKYDGFTAGIVKGNGVRTDTTILSDKGNIRVPYAIHESKGGVKKPIESKTAAISKRSNIIPLYQDKMGEDLKEKFKSLPGAIQEDRPTLSLDAVNGIIPVTDKINVHWYVTMRDFMLNERKEEPGTYTQEKAIVYSVTVVAFSPYDPDRSFDWRDLGQLRERVVFFEKQYRNPNIAYDELKNYLHGDEFRSKVSELQSIAKEQWEEYDKRRGRYFEYTEGPKADVIEFPGTTSSIRAWKDQLPGGLADKKKPSDFDQKQLEMGIKVEMEHVDDEDLAKEISMDHLSEDPKYYDKLKTIEKHESRQISIRAARSKDDPFYGYFVNEREIKRIYELEYKLSELNRRPYLEDAGNVKKLQYEEELRRLLYKSLGHLRSAVGSVISTWMNDFSLESTEDLYDLYGQEADILLKLDEQLINYLNDPNKYNLGDILVLFSQALQAAHSSGIISLDYLTIEREKDEPGKRLDMDWEDKYELLNDLSEGARTEQWKQDIERVSCISKREIVASIESDLIKKYPGIRKEIEQLSSRVDKKYLKWAVHQLVNYIKNQKPFSIALFIDYINEFETYKQYLPSQDIYSYTLPQLISAISNVKEMKGAAETLAQEYKNSFDAYRTEMTREEAYEKVRAWLETIDQPFQSMVRKELRKNISKREKARGKEDQARENSDIIYEDDNFLVVHPGTTQASCYFGSRTQWCVAATESENMFEEYSGEGTFLYYIINKNAGSDDVMGKIAYALNKESEYNEIFDKSDSIIREQDVREYLGKYYNKIVALIKNDLQKRDVPRYLNYVKDMTAEELQKRLNGMEDPYVLLSNVIRYNKNHEATRFAAEYAMKKDPFLFFEIEAHKLYPEMGKEYAEKLSPYQFFANELYNVYPEAGKKIVLNMDVNKIEGMYSNYWGITKELYPEETQVTITSIAENHPDYFFRNNLDRMFPETIPLAVHKLAENYSPYFFFKYKLYEQFPELGSKLAKNIARNDPEIYFDYGLSKVYPEYESEAAKKLIEIDPRQYHWRGWEDKYPDLREKVYNMLNAPGRYNFASKSISKRVEAKVHDSAGVFVVLPKNIAKQFPSLGEHDDSATHVTALYVGKVPKSKRKLLKQVVETVCSIQKPFKVALDDKVSYFKATKHSDGCKIAKMAIVSDDLHEFHNKLKKAIGDAGIDIDDHFPKYNPHVTLSYMPPPQKTYEDKVPKGKWTVDCVEIWGIGDNHKVKFGGKNISKRADTELIERPDMEPIDIPDPQPISKRDPEREWVDEELSNKTYYDISKNYIAGLDEAGKIPQNEDEWMQLIHERPLELLHVKKLRDLKPEYIPLAKMSLAKTNPAYYFFFNHHLNTEDEQTNNIAFYGMLNTRPSVYFNKSLENDERFKDKVQTAGMAVAKLEPEYFLKYLVDQNRFKHLKEIALDSIERKKKASAKQISKRADILGYPKKTYKEISEFVIEQKKIINKDMWWNEVSKLRKELRTLPGKLHDLQNYTKPSNAIVGFFRYREDRDNGGELRNLISGKYNNIQRDENKNDYDPVLHVSNYAGEFYIDNVNENIVDGHMYFGFPVFNGAIGSSGSFSEDTGEGVNFEFDKNANKITIDAPDEEWIYETKKRVDKFVTDLADKVLELSMTDRDSDEFYSSFNIDSDSLRTKKMTSSVTDFVDEIMEVYESYDELLGYIQKVNDVVYNLHEALEYFIGYKEETKNIEKKTQKYFTVDLDDIPIVVNEDFYNVMKSAGSIIISVVLKPRTDKNNPNGSCEQSYYKPGSEIILYGVGDRSIDEINGTIKHELSHAMQNVLDYYVKRKGIRGRRPGLPSHYRPETYQKYGPNAGTQEYYFQHATSDVELYPRLVSDLERLKNIMIRYNGFSDTKEIGDMIRQLEWRDTGSTIEQRKAIWAEVNKKRLHNFIENNETLRHLKDNYDAVKNDQTLDEKYRNQLLDHILTSINKYKRELYRYWDMFNNQMLEKVSKVSSNILKRAGRLDYPEKMYKEIYEWAVEEAPRLKKRILRKSHDVVETAFDIDISDTEQFSKHPWMLGLFNEAQSLGWDRRLVVRLFDKPIENQGTHVLDYAKKFFDENEIEDEKDEAWYGASEGEHEIWIFDTLRQLKSGSFEQSLKHELTHMMQNILNTVITMRREKKFDDAGLPAPPTDETDETPHVSKEIEFYPILNEELVQLQNYLKNSVSDRDARIQFVNYVDNSSNLQRLKNLDYNLFQKMVRELYKAIDIKTADLSTYQKKRDFGTTPEPEGKVEKGKNKHRFVIQDHNADKAGRHYDLRFETDEGVMESFVIPKAKLPTGKERLLVIKSEDHPLSYRKFEGEIEEGYGKGTVKIHDSGTYKPIEYTNNLVKVELSGKKEKGKYTIKHTSGNKWLIMLSKDEEEK